jgi:outer membrane protein assembly factor BamB
MPSTACKMQPGFLLHTFPHPPMRNPDLPVGRRIVIALALLGALHSKASFAQDPRPPAASPWIEIEALEQSVERLLPGGAGLKSAAEHRQLLERADQFAADGRIDLAAALWQRVLDAAGDALVPEKIIESSGPGSSPLVLYRPLAQRVERRIGRSPPDVLNGYRISADAEAQALVSASRGESEPALQEIARRFFLSSIGDDAALKLAGVALDRHDFAAARRLLERLLADHPDGSALRTDALARLGVAAAHLHDREAAEKALAELHSTDLSVTRAENAKFIEAHVKKTLATTNATPARQSPALPTSSVEDTLTEAASYELPLEIAAKEPGAQAAASREQLIARWKSGAWRPAARLLFDDQRVYWKSPSRLISHNRQAFSDEPTWQSAWQNQYAFDNEFRRFASESSGPPGDLQATRVPPQTATESFYFADRVHHAMSICGDVVYSLEGKRATLTDASAPSNRGTQWSAAPRRSRNNWLTAYRASSGKAIWTRSAVDVEADDRAEIGFLAAPTLCAGALLIPITDGGSISLLALDPASGKTRWKTFLCDEPLCPTSPWAEIVMAVDGQEAYLTCGCGLVFAIDGAAGSIHWAVRHARDGLSAAGDDPAAERRSQPRGWDDDLVLIHGPLAIVMPSDSSRILALNRITGERVWEVPRVSSKSPDVRYCLGLAGDRLYVAGSNIVRAYEASTGRIVGEQALENSLGRGCLTAAALYLPAKNSILKFDLSLKLLGRVRVVLPSDEPVGSLFSAGERLWVVGAARVYPTMPLHQRLGALSEQIAAGDAGAQWRRATLYWKDNESALALRDIEAAFANEQSRTSSREAVETLLLKMKELKLPQADPLAALGLLSRLVSGDATTQGDRAAAGARLNEVLGSCISALRQQRPPNSVAALTRISPLLSDEYLVNAAALAVDALAGPEDAEELAAALRGDSAPGQLISISALARIDREQARPLLRGLLAASDDRVQLAAARALANRGEAGDVLETLVRLLDSRLVSVRSQSHRTLEALTGHRIPFASGGAVADRALAASAWRDWIKTHGATAKFKIPLRDREAKLDRLLVVSPGLVVELDSDRKERWRMQLPGAAWGGQSLPNGHRLIAINAHSMIIEYDDTGKEVWRKDRLPGPPSSVQRLDSGATLVACGSANQIVEIAPDGSTRTITIPGRPVFAERLDNGNTLVTLMETNRVVEVDADGKTLWEADTLGMRPAHATRLTSGGTLLTLAARKVVELDPTGTIVVWSSRVSLINPTAALRLPSGNTLIADHNGVQEVDATGTNVLWRHRQQEVTSISAF